MQKSDCVVLLFNDRQHSLDVCRGSVSASTRCRVGLSNHGSTQSVLRHWLGFVSVVQLYQHVTAYRYAQQRDAKSATTSVLPSCHRMMYRALRLINKMQDGSRGLKTPPGTADLGLQYPY